MNIYMIEDNEDDVVFVREQLTMAKEETFTFESVGRLDEALKQLPQVSPDVILLDLALPDKKELETLEQTRSRMPDTPVIVLTGLYDDSTGVAAVQVGAQDYVRKDEVTGKMLWRMINHALERFELTKQLEQERSELMALNNVLVDREHHMIALKKENNQLLQELGRPQKYEEDM